MCITIEELQPNYFCFDHQQYDEEVALMRKRIEKIMTKVEKTNLKVYKLSTYEEFKNSIIEGNHENLK